ncbi:hypothetical protein WICPIJ_002499 [Wickerhamomyces pijperi]|uniref:Secreted protein n=1 Tax=Wickerhamomyces pijperi TaxID=599730 RepID=A0A9P8TPL2_WICPI|nr:hypothetical protein WICPIJ_002499 [Wickerhamomyces pijperi]
MKLPTQTLLLIVSIFSLTETITAAPLTRIRAPNDEDCDTFVVVEKNDKGESVFGHLAFEILDYPLTFKIEKPEDKEEDDIKRKFFQFSNNKFKEEKLAKKNILLGIDQEESSLKLNTVTSKILESTDRDHVQFIGFNREALLRKQSKINLNPVTSKALEAANMNSKKVEPALAATDFRGRPQPTKTPEQERNWNRIKPNY